MYPFLYQIISDEDMRDITGFEPDGQVQVRPKKFVVKIAKAFDYVAYESRWMDDAYLGNQCLVPDVDITENTYYFATESEAVSFIKEWWSRQ